MKKYKLIMALFLFGIIIVGTNKVCGMTIVLDPGHGGTDTGSSAINGDYERNMNMKVANYLKEYLEPYDVNVYLTHETVNDSMTIFQRGTFIRAKKADIGISLHFNSAPQQLNGAEVYVTRNTSLPKYNKNSTELGNMILNNLNSLGIGNRGVKTRNSTGDNTDIYSDGTISDYYGIIRYSMRGCKIDYGKITPVGSIPANVQNGEGVPAIIIEHCFINGSDIQFCNTNDKLKKIAEADGKAIVDYYGIPLKKVREKLKPFEDVYVDDWYASAVQYTLGKNLIKGYSDTVFAPNDKITRGMLVTILHRMEGNPWNDGKSKFDDVESDKYYSQAIKWATDNKIVSGYEGVNKFGPNDLIKREDIIVILNNYAKYNNKNKFGETDLSKFSDYKSIDKYAYNAVEWAVSTGVITGNANGTIAPQQNATRAEAAAIIQKFCLNVIK